MAKHVSLERNNGNSSNYMFGFSLLSQRMDMKCVLAVLIIITLSCDSSHPLSDNFASEREVYQIYSSLLTHEDSPSNETKIKQIIIENSTITPPKDLCEPEKLLGYYNLLTPFLKSALADFKEKGHQVATLQPKFILRKTSKLISPTQLDSIFKDNPNGWDSFYKQYPDSSGIIGFSQIGFNAARTTALLYSVRSCGLLCGDGSFYIFTKNEGNWKMTKELKCFLS